MLQYCPNCKDKKIDNETQLDREHHIWTNIRDGYGSMFKYRLCPHCAYPLCGVFERITTETNEDEIEYHVSIIENYQNGHYASKNDVLSGFIKKYEKDLERINDILDACDYFVD